MSGGAGSSVHPSGMPERSTPAGDPDVAEGGVEGAASCTRSEKVVHAKTAAAANTAKAIAMAVTRRLAEGPEGDAPGGLSITDQLHDHWDWDHRRAVPACLSPQSLRR